MGVTLAATINLRALTSFVEFVRASTTPVYKETEPRKKKSSNNCKICLIHVPMMMWPCFYWLDTRLGLLAAVAQRLRGNSCRPSTAIKMLLLFLTSPEGSQRGLLLERGGKRTTYCGKTPCMKPSTPFRKKAKLPWPLR